MTKIPKLNKEPKKNVNENIETYIKEFIFSISMEIVEEFHTS